MKQKILYKFLLVWTILFVCVNCTSAENEKVKTISTALIHVFINPEKYLEHELTLSGYLFESRNEVRLYLNKDDALTRNKHASLRVFDSSPKFNPENLKPCLNNYVYLIARFNKDSSRKRNEVAFTSVEDISVYNIENDKTELKACWQKESS